LCLIFQCVQPSRRRGNTKLEEMQTIAQSAGAKVVARIDLGTLHRTMQMLAATTDDVLFAARPDGLFCRTTDPAHICMIETLVRLEAMPFYDRWQCPDPKDNYEFAIGLNSVAPFMGALWKTVDMMKQEVFLSVEDSKGTAPVLTLATEHLRGTFTLYDPAGMKHPKSPEEILGKQLVAKTAVRAKNLLDVIEQIAAISDHVLFQMGAADYKLFLTGNNDMSEVTGEVHPVVDEPAWAAAQAKTTVPCEYVTSFLKLVTPDTTVTIRLGTDYPMRFSWESGRVDDEPMAEYVYLIAPRISTSED